MRSLGQAVSVAVVLSLVATAVTATEPLVAEPRMVGDFDGGKLYVEDATAVGDDFAFLGTRGRERLSLRWVDAQHDRERKLQTVWSGEMPRELATARGGVIFTGLREQQGTEPWRSDGTRARTKLIREIHTGRETGICASPSGDCPTYPAGSDPQSFVTIGRTTYFAADHPSYGRELWRTDGTRRGTRMVRDIRPGAGPGLRFSWHSLVEYKGQLYFVADDGQHGSELWRTDGTRQGTRMVRDIRPGWSAAWWATPLVAGDYLYFTARRQDEGLELWRTDGTRKGTRLVRDIWPGPKPSTPEHLTAVGDALYFTAKDPQHGRELWRTDGTRKGTALVSDLSPGRANSHLGDLVGVGDTLYFTAWDVSDEPFRPGGLWRTVDDAGKVEPVLLETDDSAALTRRWSEYPTTAFHQGRLYITAIDEVHGNEVWMIDGGTGRASLLADIRTGPRGSRPEWLTVADSVLYLTAADGEHGRQLWALPLEAPTAS